MYIFFRIRIVLSGLGKNFMKPLDNVPVHTHKCANALLDIRISTGLSMPRFLFISCLLAALLSGEQHSAQAAQWQALGVTARYKVEYDEQSIRMTHQGQMDIILRYIPKVETGRKSAATEYKDKRYRSHLEYYKIDCSEQTALLGFVDVLGSKEVRLKRLQDEKQPEPILPGSLLDIVALRICPVPVEEPEEADKGAKSDQAKAGTPPLSSDQARQIERLQKSAESKDATAETWKELGNIYFDTDQPEQAISASDKAPALLPDDIDILNDQGAMYRQTGDYQKALANFEKANTIDPKNLDSLYNSGYVYAFDLNNIPKALILWKRYIELESESEVARQLQSFIEQYGK